MFHHACIAVGTALGTISLMTAFLARGDCWRGILGPQVPGWNGHEGATAMAMPRTALTDGPWIIVPLTISVCIALLLTMRVYRTFVAALSGNRRQRERLWRAGWYASAIVPVLMATLGLTAILGVMLYEESPLLAGAMRGVAIAAVVLLGGLSTVAFLLPAMVHACGEGKRRIIRAVLMFPVFPCAAIVIFYGVANVVFWSLGYAAIAIWSMAH
ncbi:MAG TPA: hypothetical protein VHM90_21250 [Phycisphaerae bacterium]|nr:hypothetical protein [Phycisphaerae bacterium]